MSESLHPTFEAEQPKTPEQLNQETLISLGSDFNVVWDAYGDKADFSKLRNSLLSADKTFNSGEFFKALAKLNPKYLEYIQGMFKKEMDKFYEESKKLKTVSERVKLSEEYLPDYAESFINKVEYFSRLKPPKTAVTGGKTRDQLITEMEQNRIRISIGARQMMDSIAFTTTKKPQKVDFVHTTVRDLFDDSKKHTIAEIYSKVTEKFGLELCQSEDGPNYRLAYTNQPEGEYARMGTKQIFDPDGYPRVFDLTRDEGGVWLLDYNAMPGGYWEPEFEFVFRLPNPEPKQPERN